MPRDQVISSLVELTQLQASLDPEHFYCFRGQSNASWDLVPSMYREIPRLRPALRNEDHKWIAQIERDIYRFFEDRGRRLFVNQNPLRNKWEQLCLAQHYGTPTRLLDWSKSIYVATYFACLDNIDADGSVWIMDVTSFPFLELQGRRPENNGYRIEQLAAAIPVEDVSFFKLLSQPGTGRRRVKPGFFTLIEPPSIDGRIVNQDGVFSIHITFDDNDLVWDHTNGIRTIENERAVQVLQKVVIPKEKKDVIRIECERAQLVDLYRLFPDLVGLGRLLSEEKRNLFARKARRRV